MARKDFPSSPLHEEPLVLIVPGNDDAASRQWAARLEANVANAVRLELGNWEKPHRNTWVNRLNMAVMRPERPVVVIAHGLACLALIWWVEYETPEPDGPLRGALLFDPPDVDRPGSLSPGNDPRLAAFPSCPRGELSFPASVLASESRDASSLRSLRQLALDWDATFEIVATADDASLRAGRPPLLVARRFLAVTRALIG